MLDLIREWPPVERPRIMRPRTHLRTVTNHIRQRHNYRILDAALILAAKQGHIVRRWDWLTPNTLTASCMECGAVLNLDTEAEPGSETYGSPILLTHCV
jgi:hypothetical protein